MGDVVQTEEGKIVAGEASGAILDEVDKKDLENLKRLQKIDEKSIREEGPGNPGKKVLKAASAMGYTVLKKNS